MRRAAYCCARIFFQEIAQPLNGFQMLAMGPGLLGFFVFRIVYPFAFAIQQGIHHRAANVLGDVVRNHQSQSDERPNQCRQVRDRLSVNGMRWRGGGRCCSGRNDGADGRGGRTRLLIGWGRDSVGGARLPLRGSSQPGCWSQQRGCHWWRPPPTLSRRWCN